MKFIWPFWKNSKKSTEPKNIEMDLDINKSNEELIEDFGNIEFQWIKGENTGGVEIFSHFESTKDAEFLAFRSGTRINKALLNEYMTHFHKSDIDLSGLPQNIDSNDIVSNITNQNNTKPIESHSRNIPEKIKRDSPIYELLNKQKTNLVDIDINVEVKLPSRELYAVLISSFDNAEKDILEYVIGNLDMEEIKEKLAKSILNTYYSIVEKSEHV